MGSLKRKNVIMAKAPTKFLLSRVFSQYKFMGSKDGKKKRVGSRIWLGQSMI